MQTSEDLKTVTELGGAVRFDPIMRTYVVRIPAANLPSVHSGLSLNLGGLEAKLEYDSTRDIYFNNLIEALSQELVEGAQVIIK